MAIRRTVGRAASMLVGLASLVSLSPDAEAAVRRTVTIVAAPTAVTAGEAVNLKGKVSKSGRGTPVLIEARLGAKWNLVSKVRTKATGAYRATVTPTAVGDATYRARVTAQKVGGRKLAAATSSPVTVTVKGGQSARTLSLDVPAELVAYEITSVSGTITNTPAGLMVSIECKLPGGDWNPCGAGRTTASGTFTEDEFQIQQVGTYQVRASVPEQKSDAGTLPAATSPSSSLRVYGADNSGATKLVSITPEDNFTANDSSSGPSMSADGRYVAFVSSSAELVDGVDPDGQPQVFLRDVQDGTTDLVSVTTGGAPMQQVQWFDPVETDISADGRYVAFTSSAPDLVAGDTNDHVDVFVRDVVAGTTVLASRTSTGAVASGDPLFTFEQISLSDDGRTVLFTSQLALVPEDVNGSSDVYTRDLDGGTTTLVTRNADGQPLTKGGHMGALSGDGTHAVFFSVSDNIGPAGGAHPAGLYRRNLTTGAVDTISWYDDEYAGPPSSLDVSTTGARVVYGYGVVQLWNAATSTSTIVSENLDGEAMDAGSATISGDGSTVAFATPKPDIVTGDDRTEFVFEETYLFDVATGTITLGSVTSGGQFGGAGYFGGGSWPAGLSSDGRHLLFESDSGWLIPGDDSNWKRDVFVRDLEASS